MEQYVGLDVSLEETAVCVLDSAGKIVWRGRCSSDPEAIARIVRERAPFAVRIGLETGQLSTWLVHSLRHLGLRQRFEIARVHRVGRPDARVAVRLQLEPNRRALGALTVRTTPVDRALKVLHVVPVLVREDVGLRERTSRGAELRRELLEEPEIDIDVLIRGTVEGTDRRRGRAAAGLRPVGEQDRTRFGVSGERVRPIVLDAVHVRHDRTVLALLGIRAGLTRGQVARA